MVPLRRHARERVALPSKLSRRSATMMAWNSASQDHCKTLDGMFSYTYSRLWGNYSGLTTTDFGDGFAGRNAPNNSRSFDEPYFSWDANGQSSSGLLATDRPHAFKGYGYYELNEGHHNATDFGVFSYLYSGSPETSILDVGFASQGSQRSRQM